MRPVAGLLALTCFVSLAQLSGCSGGTSSKDAGTASLALSLSANSVTVPADGSVVSLSATVTRNHTQKSVIYSVSDAPAGLQVNIVQPDFGTIGTLKFSTSGSTASGVYTLHLSASDGSVSTTAVITATVLAIDAITMTPASTTALVLQDGTAGKVDLAFTRSFGNVRAITVSASGLPAGLSASFTQPNTSNDGSVSFTASAVPAGAGTYAITLTASDTVTTATASVSVVIAVVARVANLTDTTLGINGHLQQFMSTGFQPSIYNNAFFTTFPSATTQLAALNSRHIRLQPVHATMPWVANSSPQQASDWSFTDMDKTVQPVLNVGDNSPEMQIAMAPIFLSDSSGHFIFNSTNLALLTQYAQNLVRYYNTGGFDWGGKHFQSASSKKITWWAIYNEPNINGITVSQYVQIYNTLVPAMLAVDPSLKFTALELSGYAGQIQNYLPTLVQPAGSGGLNAQVDSISTHFYAGCNQTYTDAKVFSYTAQFVSDIAYMRTLLKNRSDLSNLPIWVTENNTNADYQQTNGYSSCNPSQIFVSDKRGTSAFFAAWRPVVFSQLGKAGNGALYHFLYEGSDQYGEVYNFGNTPYLSYWVDYWLQRTFPYEPGTSGSLILQTSSTESAPTVEILATRNADMSVSLLVSDMAVADAADNNGTGLPRTVVLDLSALGSFAAGTQVTLDASTPISSGPAQVNFTPGSTLTLTLNGYGSQLITLRP